MAYPRPMPRSAVAAAAGYEEKGGAFIRPLGELKTLGLAHYPAGGQVAATALLFPKGI